MWVDAFFRAAIVPQPIALLVQALLAGLAQSGHVQALDAHMLVGGATPLVSGAQASASVLLRRKKWDPKDCRKPLQIPTEPPADRGSCHSTSGHLLLPQPASARHLLFALRSRFHFIAQVPDYFGGFADLRFAQGSAHSRRNRMQLAF
jgi:hypothetical protein